MHVDSFIISYNVVHAYMCITRNKLMMRFAKMVDIDNST